MTRLSSPESVMEKIADVHQKIEELYETVDLIRQLKQKFEASREETGEHEARLREKLLEYDVLGEEYDRSVRRIEDLGERLESELARMVTEFGYEKDRIHEAMKGFDQERSDVRRRFEWLDREYTEAMRDAEDHMAYLAERLDAAIGEIRSRAAQAMDEDRRLIEGEMARLTEFSDRMRDEAQFQEENLRIFQDGIETLLDDRTEALEEKHKAHADGVAEEIRRFEETMTGFRERIETILRDRTDELLERQDRYKQSTTLDLDERFSLEAEKLTERADDEIRKLHDGFDAEKESVDGALLFLAEEKTAVDQRHAAIDQEMERIDSAIESLIESARDRVDRTIEDGNAVIEGQVDHVTAFIAASEEEVQRLKGDLKGFKDRLSANSERDAAALRKQQADFQQVAEQELNARLSEEAKQLRMAADREIQALAGERKEIAEMHQVLEDSLDRVNRKIGAKSTYFSTQLNQLIVKSQKEITQLGESATEEVRARLAGLTDFTDSSREELHTLKTRIQEFVDLVRERLDRDIATLRQGQSDFKKSAVRKISAKLSEEAKRLRAANEAALDARMAELADRHQRMSDAANARLQDFEERITASESTLAKGKADQREQAVKIQGHLKRFSEKQSAHSKTLPTLEERIAALENHLEEIGQRRGLFNFPKSPKTKNPGKE